MKRVETITTRTAYQNQWMRVREDNIRLPDGTPGIYGVVEKGDYSVIVPMDDENLYFVEQFRYAPSVVSLEFPQGSKEFDERADPLDVAHQELSEETGIQATDMKSIGHIHVAPGYSTQRAIIFLATGLAHGAQQLELTEQGLSVHAIAPERIMSLIDEGRISDSATISALLLASRVIPDLARHLFR